MLKMLNSASFWPNAVPVGMVGDAVAVLIVAVDQHVDDLAQPRPVVGEVLTSPDRRRFLKAMIATRSDGVICVSMYFSALV